MSLKAKTVFEVVEEVEEHGWDWKSTVIILWDEITEMILYKGRRMIDNRLTPPHDKASVPFFSFMPKK